jgi:hypothetical protein
MLGRSAVTRSALGRALGIGAVAGVIGAVVMAAFAMIAAATYQHHGFFTPMYHIASLVLSPRYMMASAQHAMAGDAFTLFGGPLAIGLLIHVVVGAGYGLVFGLLVGALRPVREAIVPAGLLFGAVALAFSWFVGLPAAAAAFDAGPPIRDMPAMAGSVTFSVEHLVFGLVLGAVTAALWPAVRRTPAVAVPRPAEAA